MRSATIGAIGFLSKKPTPEEIQRNFFIAVKKNDLEEVKSILGGMKVEYVKKFVNSSNKTIAEFRPLIIAIKNKNIPMIELLLNKGADFNQADNVGNRPLHHAVMSNCKEVVELLLDRNPDGVDDADNDGTTLVIYATKIGLSKKVVELLLDKGANVNKNDNLGNTSLHYAIMKDRSEDFVKFLLEKGADSSLSNKSGLKPSDLAKLMNDSKELIDLLSNKGANVNLQVTGGEFFDTAFNAPGTTPCPETLAVKNNNNKQIL